MRSVSTWVHVHTTVNVDKEQRQHLSGTPSRTGWMDKQLLSPFKMKDHAITLNTQSSVKIGGQAVHVYMILNFHAAPYEICSHPPARPS